MACKVGVPKHDSLNEGAGRSCRGGLRYNKFYHYCHCYLCHCATGGTVAVIAMKLAMYLACRGSSDPSVRAFALDHINDVVVNSVGLAGLRQTPFPFPLGRNTVLHAGTAGSRISKHGATGAIHADWSQVPWASGLHADVLYKHSHERRPAA